MLFTGLVASILVVSLPAGAVGATEFVPLAQDGGRKAPVYRLPFPDAPKVRVDGHVRGTEDAALTLTVLAPERTGLTTKKRPSLYWFQSEPVTNRFEVTITERKAVKPLLEARFEASGSGIQRLRLSDYNIRLAENVEYRWSVAIVPDPENRSKDVVASGIIERVKPTEKLLQRLRGAPPSELPYIYADEGIWYDSLEALSDLVDAKPRDAKLHEIRAVYFMQVGLHDAAMHEIQLSGKTAKDETR